jgi:hypothetical protein
VTVTAPPPAPAPEEPRRVSPWAFVLGPVIVAFAAFWIWALFFASKTAVNKIEDRGWAERGESICADAREQLEDLADYRRVDPDDPAMLAERAELVDRATDVLESMLDDVVAVTPTDEKGRAIVPDWESEYRTYLENRRDFADRVRAGDYGPFTEEFLEVPVGERVATFAGDNEMPSCAPPNDLSF